MGDANAECLSCSGSGTDMSDDDASCLACHGTGAPLDNDGDPDAVCLACDGKGFHVEDKENFNESRVTEMIYENEAMLADCEQCGGSGDYMMDTCPMCFGTGVDMSGPDAPCPECMGSGKDLEDSATDCLVCGGSGNYVKEADESTNTSGTVPTGGKMLPEVDNEASPVAWHPNCDGAGEEYCETCDGSGTDATGETCEDCSGEGVNMCPHCNPDVKEVAEADMTPVSAIHHEGTSFDRFMDRILINEGHKKTSTQKKKTPQQVLAERVQERPASRTRYGVK